MHAFALALFLAPLAALGQPACGAPTPADIEGPFYKAGAPVRASLAEMGPPRHIHVKLQRPGGPVLTTQLYFPGEARRENPALVVKFVPGQQGRTSVFDFVL